MVPRLEPHFKLERGHSTELPIRDGVGAIRARTPAQIESTQIARPRPHRIRGGQVENAPGTGDLA
jgi:hypothetical protein